jgi:methionyl-tRNA formyltransferase
MRLVFFGTPEFALPSLQVLCEGPHQVIGVVSAPPKPQGRGMIMRQPPVVETAASLGIPVLQPERLLDPVFLATLEQWNADVFTIVAFRILPEAVFGMPRFGAINLHGSLLPAYRGAAPIQWALWKGEKETGLTTFTLEKSVDTGNILKQCKVEISVEDDAGSLSERMALAGSELLAETLKEIEQGTLVPRVQDSHLATPAPKITKGHCWINWQQSAIQIRNQVRALSPEPGAMTEFNGQVLKIFRCNLIAMTPDLDPGEVLIENQAFIIGTGSGALSLEVLQQQGKNRIEVGPFLRGYRPRGKFHITR